jgi:hypothetical protein
MGRLPTLITRPDGEVLGINMRRLAEIPFFLTPNQPNEAIVVPAQQSSAPVVASVSGEGPVQVFALARESVRAAALQANADMRVFLQIQDGPYQRGLMNGAAHVDTIMGSVGLPYRLPEALYMDELRSLIQVYTNLNTTLANTIRPCFDTDKFLTQQIDTNISRIRKRMEQRQYLSVPYWYVLDQGFLDVGIGATAQATITIGQDHHFEWSKQTAFVHQVGDTTITGPWDINIVDISKGESFIDAPQNVDFPISGDLIFGTGQFPYNMHVPRLAQVGMRMVVTIVNRHVAAQRFFITLGGRALALRMWT